MKNVVAFALMLLFVFALIGTEVMMVAGKPLLTLYKTSRELVERGHPDIT
jgi:hypothetical protein